MSWRDDPITEKQKELIERMDEDAGMNGAILPLFTGKKKAKQVIGFLQTWGNNTLVHTVNMRMLVTGFSSTKERNANDKGENGRTARNRA